MIPNPQSKYRPFPPIDLPDRQWPSRTITAPPIWLSTDLRDGNQALFDPMNKAKKLRLFDELVRVGFKEIELGFPAASQIDFDVIRHLIENDRIPDDVTPMVLTQARPELIERTIESVRGAKRVIVHVYNATAPLWRRVVFNMSVDEMLKLVDTQVTLIKRLTDARPGTDWRLQYSPETFSMTELEVSLAACNTATRAWDAGPGRPIIHNLPTTVEVATPNVFADQVEWMHRHLERREHVVLSVHSHNDRGTGVACAELAMLAGAQRVEGCLFGNGERSGNVDIVTLALNLYTEGVHPGLDFSDINATARIAEECTQLPIHPRHPYVGDLVFTSFSGSHQDAIKKGFAARKDGDFWEMPYLPIDPADVGRSYESIVRVNSQSGKGGIAYLLERDHGVVMPRRMQIEFSAIVQKYTDASEAEITSQKLWELFEQTYLACAEDKSGLVYKSHHLHAADAGHAIDLDVIAAGRPHTLQGQGANVLDAVAQALPQALRIDGHELLKAANGDALVIVEAANAGSPGARFGAGRHADRDTASILAVLNAAARLSAKPAA
ncbi:MAG: 2-isopropylmalate synthase [Rudaea sp.]|uniref:2-isopropylmalate synthase n=1 Tax=Rudaea sp. TaxID=2136325 RepID=UPI0039E37BF1